MPGNVSWASFDGLRGLLLAPSTVPRCTVTSFAARVLSSAPIRRQPITDTGPTTGLRNVDSPPPGPSAAGSTYSACKCAPGSKYGTGRASVTASALRFTVLILKCERRSAWERLLRILLPAMNGRAATRPRTRKNILSVWLHTQRIDYRARKLPAAKEAHLLWLWHGSRSRNTAALGDGIVIRRKVEGRSVLGKPRAGNLW